MITKSDLANRLNSMFGIFSSVYLIVFEFCLHWLIFIVQTHIFHEKPAKNFCEKRTIQIFNQRRKFVMQISGRICHEIG
jgi:hypothetical protein